MASGSVILVACCDDFSNDAGWESQIVCSGTENADGVLVLRIEGGVRTTSYNIVVEVSLHVD